MITLKEVEHVAKLARLSLTDAEKQLFTEQLSKILDYFAALKEVDTEAVEPLAHTSPLLSVMRDDEVVLWPGRASVLDNAPCQENGFFKVPRINE